MILLKSTTNIQFKWIMLTIFVISFILRIAICYELQKNDIQVSRPSAATDMATYMELSRNIVDGKFNQEFYYQPFYYAIFLPSIIFLFGKGIWPVLIVQSLLSSLTVVFTGICAAMLSGKRAGIIASFLIAFSSCLCLYVPYHLIATLQAFWIILISYTAILALRKKSLPCLIICGIICSFAILTRGNIWFFIPGIAIFAFLSEIKKNLNKGLLFSLIFLITVIIPQLPFAYWNYLKTSKLTGASTAAGAVLGLGNTPEAPPGGRNPGLGPGPMEYPETYMEWSAQQKDNSILKRIVEWATSEPLAFLELQFRKALLFWDHREIPNNIAFEYNGQKSLIWKTFAFIPSSILISLFLSWIFFRFILILKRKKIPFKKLFSPVFLNIYLILAYWLATIAFYNLARFRAPSLPLFAIFAGIFICDFRNIFRHKNEEKYNKLKSVLISLLISIFIVFFSYDCYRFYEPAIMRFVRPNGTKVKLNEEKILILDNGPFTFGGWELIELKEGDEVLKKFSIPDFKTDCVAKFSFEIYFSVPGKVILEVNNTEKEISSDHEGKMEQTIHLENLSSPEINIKIKNLDAKILALIDTQRNYSRTLINKKNPGGELVSRLYLIEKPSNLINVKFEK